MSFFLNWVVFEIKRVHKNYVGLVYEKLCEDQVTKGFYLVKNKAIGVFYNQKYGGRVFGSDELGNFVLAMSEHPLNNYGRSEHCLKAVEFPCRVAYDV